MDSNEYSYRIQLQKIDIINCRFIWLSSSIVFHSGSEPPISGFKKGVSVARPLGIGCRENTDRDFKILIVKLKLSKLV